MEDTDFDLLCAGLSADDARRMRKIFVEWCDGDENGFPVQLALLTRAQWRATARIPLLVAKARDQFAADFVEQRHKIWQMFSGFQEVLEDKLKVMDTIVTTHSQNARFMQTEMDSQLTNVENVGEQIKADLKQGSSTWNQSRADFEAERQKLEQARKELDSRENWRDWFVLCGLLFAVFVIGIGVGQLLHK
jgi:hypothetical protein